MDHISGKGSFHVEHTTMERLERCLLCGSIDLVNAATVEDHSISKENFNVCECGSCGYRFTNPRPNQELLPRYYESESYISHSNTSKSLRDKLYQVARKWSLAKKSATIGSYVPSASVLDIGCGTGDFLASLQTKGYHVMGIEPNATARHQATQLHQLVVLPSLDAVSSLEQFQVLTMWHVLEHMPDPRQTIKRAFALLQQGGYLFIAVPIRNSWDAQHYGSGWAALDVPRHLSHFRDNDVRRILADQGFQMVGERKMWLDAFYIAMLSEQYKGRGPFVALLLGTLLGLWSNIQSVLSGRPTSSILFIAKKGKG